MTPEPTRFDLPDLAKTLNQNETNTHAGRQHVGCQLAVVSWSVDLTGHVRICVCVCVFTRLLSRLWLIGWAVGGLQGLVSNDGSEQIRKHVMMGLTPFCYNSDAGCAHDTLSKLDRCYYLHGWIIIR
jgi:hypothetical protein